MWEVMKRSMTGFGVLIISSLASLEHNACGEGRDQEAFGFYLLHRAFFNAC